MPEAVLSEAAQTLLIRLRALLAEKEFYLAGGSGLALELRHRFSDDLDFFRASPFDAERLASLLRRQAERFEPLLVEQDTVVAFVDGVRVGLFKYEVPLRYPIVDREGIRLADWRDVLAEKLKTVSQRGSKKDFYDLYEIFTRRLSVPEGVAIFKARFAGTGLNFYHVLRSLTYFEDADGEPDPRLLDRAYGWEEVKRFFVEHVREFEKEMFRAGV
ncbi:MAG: nucleotidyl transferase AbiEii/AbiGii toxin family protein [Nitrospirota bacterium]